jgi:HEAT repeat protein
MGLLLGVCALALVPGIVGATDPVEALKQALKINLDSDNREMQLKQRPEKVANAIKELKTITQLRRAYFLKEWPLTRDVPDPATDVDKYRKQIGAAVLDAIRKAALEPDADRQIAAVMLISELAENDQPNERSATGKFASVFTELLAGGGKTGPGLIKNNDVFVRQIALHALGKITPNPAEVFPAGRARPFETGLRDPEVGPRRVAAFALSDLIKNAHYLGKYLDDDKRILDASDELKTYVDAVRTAHFALSDPKEDEIVRGYALQAIQQSAMIFTDYPISPGTAIHIETQGEARFLNPHVAAILAAHQQVGPRIVAALKDDPSPNIRLAALEALTQMVGARTKIMDKLFDANDKRVKRDQLFAAFKATDPIAFLFQVEKADGPNTRWAWEAVPSVLTKDASPRVRRSAMAFLENVADDVEAALEAKQLDTKEKFDMRRRLAKWVTPGLRDKDQFVRWSAARTVKHLSLDVIDGDMVEALGEMLIEHADRDPDPANAALASLQSIAASPFAPRAIRYLKSAIADRERDVELREQALATLVLIGGKGANAAFPEVTSVLSDPDFRIRRAAAEALGQLGRPATREILDTTLAALKEALRDEDAVVRQNASEAILSIQGMR